MENRTHSARHIEHWNILVVTQFIHVQFGSECWSINRFFGIFALITVFLVFIVGYFVLGACEFWWTVSLIFRKKIFKGIFLKEDFWKKICERRFVKEDFWKRRSILLERTVFTRNELISIAFRIQYSELCYYNRI